MDISENFVAFSEYMNFGFTHSYLCMYGALFFGKVRFVRHECMIHVLSHAKINMQVLKIQNEKKQMRCSLTYRAVGRFENL